jgi:hypothetical protein
MDELVGKRLDLRLAIVLPNAEQLQESLTYLTNNLLIRRDFSIAR